VKILIDMIKKLFIVVSVPSVFIIVVLLVSNSYKEWENPLIAAGTVGAAVSAIWAVIYLEIIKPNLDSPILEIREPGFDPKFYRLAPQINRKTGQQDGIGYYINILLKNKGKRTAKNCQPLLIGMWELAQGKWQKERNWISVPLRWAAGEEKEYDYPGKLREERNIIPNRPYYFNLGKISTQHPDKFIILDLPRLTAQRSKFDAGKYCFEVTVTGEEVNLDPKYFYLTWRGRCTDKLKEVEQRFEVSMKGYPPS
jgi:hypothetical protein